MPERSEDIQYLRGLAARLRSLAMTEPSVASQLEKMADEAEARAEALAAGRREF